MGGSSPDKAVTRQHCRMAWVRRALSRFGDLFNLVSHTSYLLVAWEHVAHNKGARTAGVDGLTVRQLVQQGGVGAFLAGIAASLKDGTYRPCPVRRVLIPKPGGKSRPLGIPTLADRVVQQSLKLVLEPIFEADFVPVSYGFRPKRRAHDAVAEIHYYATRGYRWVVDADIAGCFDHIDQTALLARVRERIKDKQVMALVRAFLKAGVLDELGREAATIEGTPQGGIISPLLANIALSVLDEAIMAPWAEGGDQSTQAARARRRYHGKAVSVPMIRRRRSLSYRLFTLCPTNLVARMSRARSRLYYASRAVQ